MFHLAGALPLQAVIIYHSAVAHQHPHGTSSLVAAVAPWPRVPFPRQEPLSLREREIHARRRKRRRRSPRSSRRSQDAGRARRPLRARQASPPDVPNLYHYCGSKYHIHLLVTSERTVLRGIPNDGESFVPNTKRVRTSRTATEHNM